VHASPGYSPPPAYSPPSAYSPPPGHGPPPPYTAPGYGTPAGHGSPTPPAWGTPPPAVYGPYGSPQPGGFAPPQKTNGLAITSLVTGILGLCGIGSLVGIITGFVALNQISTRREKGRGLAIGGVVAGFVTLLLSIPFWIGFAEDFGEGFRQGFEESLQETVQEGSIEAQPSQEPDSTSPFPPNDTPYPVYGSTDLVRFLGQSMIVRDETIRVGDHSQDASGPELEDALLEAAFQNPYAIDVSRYSCAGYTCRVVYGYGADEHAALQRQLLTRSEEVLAAIIDESMSDEQKVVAINRWLTRNATYDDDAADALEANSGRAPEAFLYAWNATGVMMNGKGVCESYAQAFNLLANAAGVTSVFVSGTLTENGGAHAWNKVNINGEWKAIDVTWNAGPPINTHFLLINDSEFTGSAARTEDTDWMIDAFIPDYATP